MTEKPTLINKIIAVKNKYNAWEILIMIACLLFLVMTVCPIIKLSTYSVLSADDYTFAKQLKYGISPLKFTKNQYYSWLGTYTSSFLDLALCPVGANQYSKIKAIMIINNSAIFVSMIAFIFAIVNKLNPTKKWVSAICVALYMYVFTSYGAYEEVYTWYSGCTAYGIPISAFLLGFVCVIIMGNYYENKVISIILMVVASILGLIGAGGALCIVGFGCYALCIYGVYLLLTKQKYRNELIVFIIWVIGALINACAPGNFRRHGYIDDSGVYPVFSMKRTVELYRNRIDSLFQNTSVGVVILLLVVCGILFGVVVELKKSTPWIVLLLTILAPIVNAFPVMLGNSTPLMPDYVQFNNRCFFIFDISIYMMIGACALFVGIVLRQFIDSKNTKIVVGLILLMAFSIAQVDNYRYENSVIYNIKKLDEEGAYKNYYEACKRIYDNLELCEGQDVIIPLAEYPQKVDYLFALDIQSDTSHWTNLEMQDYYGLNSLILATE